MSPRSDLAGKALMFSGGTLTFLLLLYFMNACVASALDSSGRGAAGGSGRRRGE